MPSRRRASRSPTPNSPASASRFDAAYFHRFYGTRERVHGEREIAHLARGVTELAAWLNQPIRNALDAGAGVGLWRDWFCKNLPEVRYRSIDVSPFACAQYGHEQQDLARFRSRDRYDLIVCHGVLQYLPDADAARAIDNLGAMSRGLLFLEAITSEDLRETLDLDLTDTAVNFRPAAWYRKHLRAHFRQVGAGLWASHRSKLVFYALEAAE